MISRPLKEKSVFISGHRGMVGSNLQKLLEDRGCHRIKVKDKKDLDLLNQSDVLDFFSENPTDVVFHCAAKVGGIHDNIAHGADFLYENTVTAFNVIHACRKFKIKKLVFLGSGCAYPKDVAQPMKEESLLTSSLEPTAFGMSLSKVVGIKMCELFNRQEHLPFVSVIPANLYGPMDNFNEGESHAVAALIKRIGEAKLQGHEEVTVWGTGRAVRDFLYIGDLVDALVFVYENYDRAEPLNISTGRGVSIGELATVIKEVVGFEGRLCFDETKPDGMARKVLDGTKIAELGWQPQVSLREGLEKTWDWALNTGVFGKSEVVCETGVSNRESSVTI